MAEVATQLGKVCVTPKGAWSSGTAYAVLDIVTNAGGSYLAKKDVPAGTALSNTTYWLNIVEKGAKGDTATIAVGSTTTGAEGTDASVTNSGTSTDGVFDFVIPRGNTGNGIASVEKTGSTLNVDHYRMTFTDGDYFDYDVTNASSGVWGSITGDLEDQTDLMAELNKKANVDGSYTDLTAGNAEQLVSTVFVENNTPYNFRTSGGSADIGDRLYEQVVGGTVAWNQHSDNSRTSTTVNGITFTNNGDGSITVSGTATGTATFNSVETSGEIAQVNHVYLLQGCPSGGSGNTYYLSYPLQTGSQNTDIGSGRIIKKITESSRLLTQIYINNGAIANNLIFKPQIYDLTQMFGSAIADYIYSLETAEAGAGVAWFRKLFPKDYYAYNAGELMSVNTSAHKTVGFNAWDEVWELGAIVNGANANSSSSIRGKNYYPCLPNTTYYVKSPNSCIIWWYDVSKTWLGTYANYGNSTFTIPSGAYFFRISMQSAYGTTYKNDICINLSWDGERNGEYEPYEEHSYPLDSDITLLGVPKLDASNNLYYDGDAYDSDGTVTRKYAIVDMGTLNWSYFNIEGHLRFVSYPQGIKDYDSTVLADIICPTYTVDTANNIFNNVTDKRIGTGGGGVLFVYDTTYTDAATFKAAMSGVYLVYKLATPTTESADPYQSPQVVDDWGTEEYVDARAVAIPVGHNSKYTNNLRAKLEMSPESPDGAGDYILRQTSGQNEYVALTDNATVSGLVTRCPVCPTGTNGTYVLKATVSGSTVTYTWVAE